ncbi:SUMF1/EgtB/PvdO family nonheme iron enzyme, partial [Planctomycetota bacterium]
MTDDPMIGKKVGQIEITSKLGQGGMGAVYKGAHAFLGKDVAIKFLSATLVENKEFIDRFIREAQTLARVEHKNLVRVFDAGEWEGNYYITMEFISGRSLGDILKTTARIDLAQAITIIKECAEGLNAAASQSIIHRDIKPDNIMLLDDGGVKVTDFGLAKSLESAMEITQTGQLMGTPHYMSPEQCDGMHVDFRSDMYSLGASFYRIITGKFPYEGNTPFAVMRKHLQEPLTPPSTVLNSIPSAISRIIERMMAKDATDRYTSYAELIQNLQAAQSGKPGDKAFAETVMDVPIQPEGSPPPGAVGTAPTMVRADTPAFGVGTSPTLIQGKKKNGLLIGIIAAVVLLGIGIGITVMVMSGDEDKPAQTPVQPTPADPGAETVVALPSAPVPSVPTVSDEDKAKEMYVRALEKYNTGSKDGAEILLNNIISAYPTSKYSDKALEYVSKIKAERERVKSEKERIAQEIEKIEGLISSFKIDEAERRFKALNLDIKTNPKWIEIEAAIAKLKKPINELESLVRTGTTLYNGGEYKKALAQLGKAREKAVPLGYDTGEIDRMMTAARKEQDKRDLADFQAAVEGHLKTFDFAAAEKAMEAGSKTYRRTREYLNLQSRIKDMKAKVKEVKEIKIAALEYMGREEYDKALEKLKEADSKAWGINYKIEKYDLLLKQAEEGLKSRNQYSTSFAQARKLFTDEDYLKALEWARNSQKIKDTKEVQSLIERVEKIIEGKRKRFAQDKAHALAQVESGKFKDALKILQGMKDLALSTADKTFVRDKTVEVQKLADEASRPKPLAPQISDKTRKAKMVLIPAGEATIGSNDGPKQCRPAHVVSVSAFYMDVKEVTNGEYELFDPEHKAKRLADADDADTPVTSITWDEAVAYCKWLSRKEGVTYRLPTEAEWEKAAKGGKDAQYSTGASVTGKANLSSARPVGAEVFKPNPYGLYNMSGNVWEYCQDWFGMYSAQAQIDPLNTDPGKFKAKIIRGGSFRTPAASATTFYRNGVPR